jgi:hypothetical protein
VAGQGSTAARNAPSAIQSRVPVYRRPAPSSMEAGGDRPDRPCRTKGRSGPKMLTRRRVNARAVAAPGQDAILSLAHIRNAHGKPYSDGHQGDRKRDGSDVGEHAMAKVVRLIPGAVIARQVIRLRTSGFRLSPPMRVTLPTRGADRVARPELEHPMLLLRRNGPLGLHCCRSRDILMLSSTLATHLTDNVGMAPL